MRKGWAVVVACAVALVLVPVAAAGTQSNAPSARLSPLHVVRGSQPYIADAAGRQVLLRGVNTNQLGDYYQADLGLPSTVPLTEDDFAQMAAMGFDTVRLIVHWSLLEPRRGFIDEAYLARVRQAVGWAAAHDIYVVLDMHQDAWGKYIATPKSETCLPGFEPAIGWDGAPQWATITDGLPTCRFQLRELSPAVGQAFASFWADRDGIQTELVRTWAALAHAFADNPAVAGYDLLNEPHPGLTPGVSDLTFLGRYYAAVIDAIRAAERSVPRGFAHIAFVEPMDTWSAVPVGVSPAPGFTSDGQIVFAPHIYAESITADGAIGAKVFTIAGSFEEARREAARHQTTFWSGEWGWFGDAAGVTANAGKIAEYGRQEDAHLVGGAWWQWKQSCGDPHTIGVPGGHPPPQTDSLVRLACPSNAPIGILPAVRTVLARAYPRAAPGRITFLDSDAASGWFHVRGDTDASGVLDLWAPAGGQGAPHVWGANLGNVTITPVPGGYRVSAPVTAGSYQLTLTH